MDMLNHFKV